MTSRVEICHKLLDAPQFKPNVFLGSKGGKHLNCMMMCVHPYTIKLVKLYIHIYQPGYPVLPGPFGRTTATIHLDYCLAPAWY